MNINKENEIYKVLLLQQRPDTTIINSIQERISNANKKSEATILQSISNELNKVTKDSNRLTGYINRLLGINIRNENLAGQAMNRNRDKASYGMYAPNKTDDFLLFNVKFYIDKLINFDKNLNNYFVLLLHKHIGSKRHDAVKHPYIIALDGTFDNEKRQLDDWPESKKVVHIAMNVTRIGFVHFQETEQQQ